MLIIMQNYPEEYDNIPGFGHQQSQMDMVA